MSDEELATWLRSLPREHTPEESARLEQERDAERGPWVGHQVVHHEYGESGG